MNEKWLKVLENEELMKTIVPMLPEDAQKYLAKNGYDFTLDEILEMGKQLYAIRSRMSNDGELSEEDLEDVAGGVAWGPIIKFTCKAAAGAMSVW